MRRLQKANPFGLQFLVEGVKIVSAELHVDGFLICATDFIVSFSPRRSQREKANRALTIHADHREFRQGIPFDGEAQLSAVERNRPFHAFYREGETFKSDFPGHVTPLVTLRSPAGNKKTRSVPVT